MLHEFWYDATRAVTSSYPPTLFSLSHHLAFNSSHAGMISTSHDYLWFYPGHKNCAAVAVVISAIIATWRIACVHSFLFSFSLFLCVLSLWIDDKRGKGSKDREVTSPENGYRTIRNSHSWTRTSQLARPPLSVTRVSSVLSWEHRKNSATLWYQSTLEVCHLCGSKTSNNCHHQYSISRLRMFNVFYNEARWYNILYNKNTRWDLIIPYTRLACYIPSTVIFISRTFFHFSIIILADPFSPLGNSVCTPNYHRGI